MEWYNKIPTEQCNPFTSDIDLLDTASILSVINREDSTVAGAVASAIPELTCLVEETVSRLKNGGHLYYAGAGTSGRLGVLDASECPPTYHCAPEMVCGIIAGGDTALRNAAEGAEDSPEQGKADLLSHLVTGADVVVGITASGGAPYVGGVLEAAAACGAFTALISNNPAPVLADRADLNIILPTGPEVIAGSTRMKAGTAQKMALNMISTATMIKLGKVYRNIMVDVCPTNQKLRNRAEQIVNIVTGAGDETVKTALKACGNHPKTAIISILKGVDAKEAERLLEYKNGSVRTVLSDTISAPSPVNPYFIGVDGGGTKNAVRIESPKGDLLYEGIHVGCNINVSAPEALHHYVACIESALSEAALSKRDCVALCIGMAGASQKNNQEKTERVIRSIGFTCPVIITDDGSAALYGAFEDQPGIILISGTGSICYGKSSGDELHRCGGWGHLVGDEGSGFFVGRDVINAVLKSMDGRGPRTVLSGLLSEQYQLSTPEQILHYTYQGGKSAISALAPLCEKAVVEGDTTALLILNRAAKELLSHIVSVSSHFGKGDHPIPLVLTGGFLGKSEFLQKNLLDELNRLSFIRFEPMVPKGNAASGCIVYAKKYLRNHPFAL